MIVRKVRPRFRFAVPMGADDLVRRLQDLLENADCPCRGEAPPGLHQIELRVRESDRHFWSPALSVTAIDAGNGAASVVDCLVGPNPSTWTLFAMAYFGLWTMLTFAGIFGMVQWWLGEWPWGLYASAALTLALAAMYALSQIGQRLAAPQTALLRHFLEDALNVPDAERAITDDDPYHSRPAASGGDRV